MKKLIILIGGIGFGFGLALSGMTKPEVVLSFLRLNDMGLALLMLVASLIVGIVMFFATMGQRKAPVTKESYKRRHREFSDEVVVGGIIFGLGWGISGVCPGAGFASLGTGNLPILYAILGMFIGAYAFGLFRKATE